MCDICSADLLVFPRQTDSFVYHHGDSLIILEIPKKLIVDDVERATSVTDKLQQARLQCFLTSRSSVKAKKKNIPFSKKREDTQAEKSKQVA